MQIRLYAIALVSLLGSLLGAACNSGGGISGGGPGPQGTPDLGPTDDLTPAVEAIDMGDNGAPSVMYPAPFPDPPQVVPSGGPTLMNPRIVGVFFANDVTQTVNDVIDFETRLPGTNYWRATTAEYNVGMTTTAPPVKLAETATGTIDDTQIQKWLAGKLTAPDPAFPMLQPEDIYVVHYPAEVTITEGGGLKSCSAFGGYHSNIVVAINHRNVRVAYAVLPTCKDRNLTGADAITSPESHELVEAVTDPYPMSAPAFSQVDGDHIYWAFLIGGGEVGDMCENKRSSFTRFPPEMPYLVQRTWSNAAATAGHDPCVPAPPGQVYFNAVPDLNDMIVIGGGGQQIVVPGVVVPVGMSTTIDLHLFSDADTHGPWTVSVQPTRPTNALNFSLDRDSGVNGEKLHLTITSNSALPRGNAAFEIQSTLNNRTNSWYGEVAQKAP